MAGGAPGEGISGPLQRCLLRQSHRLNADRFAPGLLLCNFGSRPRNQTLPAVVQAMGNNLQPAHGERRQSWRRSVMLIGSD